MAPTRNSSRSTSAVQTVAMNDAVAAEESVPAAGPSKVKQLAEVLANSDAEKENMINKAVPLAKKKVGRSLRSKAPQTEVAGGVQTLAPAPSAAESSLVPSKVIKKTLKKNAAVVLPEGGGERVNKDKADVTAKSEVNTAVTEADVDSVIEDLKSVEISVKSGRPTRKAAVRVNYKVLNDTGAKEAL